MTNSLNIELALISPCSKYGIDGYQKLYHLDWQYEFPGWADWDEGARPYLDIFLTLHADYTDGDFDNLITDLQNKGYGWLRPEGVRKQLDKMAKQRR